MSMDVLWGEIRSWCNDPNREHHMLHGLLERARGMYRFEMTRYVWHHARGEGLQVRAHYALLAIAACPTVGSEEEVVGLLFPGASRAQIKMLRDGSHALLSARFDLGNLRVRSLMWRVMATLRTPDMGDTISQVTQLQGEDPRIREAFLSVLACVYDLCHEMSAAARATHVEQAFPFQGQTKIRERGLWADLVQDFEVPRLL